MLKGPTMLKGQSGDAYTMRQSSLAQVAKQDRRERHWTRTLACLKNGCATQP